MSDASICSSALMRLGAEGITSLDDENDRARICKQVYEELRRSILCRHAWAFNTERGQMSREVAAPASNWTYSYIFPTDPPLLGMGPHFLYRNADLYGYPLKAGLHYRVEGNNRVLSHEIELHAVYPTDRSDQLWPPSFRQLVIAALCAEIAFAITHQQNAQITWNQQAWGLPGEGGQGGLFAQAAAENSWTVGQDEIDTDDLLAYRYS